MSDFPWIGVTAGRQKQDEPDSLLVLSEKYHRVIIEAGGFPVVLPYEIDQQHLSRILSRIDGILLTGGGDIQLELSGGDLSEKISDVDGLRDCLEFSLIDYAFREKLPFFGICRGIQVINVALGGTILNDLAEAGFVDLQHDDCLNQPPGLVKHAVSIDAGSKLAGIIGREELIVNSFHHQAIGRLSNELAAVARSRDGVIEAVELKNRRAFGLGVQWHPECMPGSESTKSLMKAFIEAAVEYASHRNDWRGGETK